MQFSTGSINFKPYSEFITLQNQVEERVEPIKKKLFCSKRVILHFTSQPTLQNPNPTLNLGYERPQIKTLVNAKENFAAYTSDEPMEWVR